MVLAKHAKSIRSKGNGAQNFGKLSVDYKRSMLKGASKDVNLLKRLTTLRRQLLCTKTIGKMPRSHLSSPHCLSESVNSLLLLQDCLGNCLPSDSFYFSEVASLDSSSLGTAQSLVSHPCDIGFVGMQNTGVMGS